MKKLLTATAATALLAGTAMAEDVKLGVLFGFTGPIESLAPAMGSGAELAMAEVTESGKLLDGTTVTASRADTGCIDNGLATSNGERMIADGVAGIIGGDCSGVTGAILQNVAIPNGMVMISPSATSPGLSTMEDNGLFFRTAPSDARQGEVLAQVVKDSGASSVAITYTNNDYGKGLADSFQSAFEAMGGDVTITAAHEDGRGDYSAEVGALASAGGDALAVLGYVDQGGRGIMEGAIDTGAFETFFLGDGMIGDSLLDLPGLGDVTTIGTAPGAEGDNVDKFNMMFTEAAGDGSGPYRGESYDAAALMILSMQKAGSADRAAIAGNIMDLANAPGEPIGPGELAKALELVAAGTDIDYVGATNVEFTDVGEAAGTYRVLQVGDGAWDTLEVK